MGPNLIRNISGLLLLAAAGLKAHQLATEPITGAGLLGSHWFLIATVEFELFFGLWLLAGILPKTTWCTALACFGLFTCISLYKAILGHASCGCFGRLPINPWYTAILDLSIMVSFLRWPPKERESALTIRFKELHIRAMAVSMIWFIVGAPAAFAMYTYSATTLSDAGNIIGNGKIVVLEPEKWIGKRFPLLDYIDIGERLKEGNWLVVLYHHDCTECLKAVPKYAEQARRLAEDPTAPRMALIEMPPYGERGESLSSQDTSCVLGRLSEEKEWFAETPVVIRLLNSIPARLD